MKAPRPLPRLCSKLFFFGLIFVLPFAAGAQSIPDRPQGYVHDEAGILSTSVRNSLEAQLSQFETDTSNQLVVATFRSLEGEPLEDLSMRYAEAWKIGQKDKNNGVLLLIFKEDRAVRIEVGYGLESVLTDATAEMIIENEIVPRFRQGLFDQGVQSAVNSIIAATRHEYVPEPKRKSEKDFPVPLIFLSLILSMLPPPILWGLFILGIVGFIVGLIIKSKLFLISSFLFGLLPLPFSALKVVNGMNGTNISGRGSRWRSGGGGWSGGGGFSGGGGSFGGGGASGRW